MASTSHTRGKEVFGYWVWPAPSDREVRKLLQFRVDLAQELLDVRHDRVKAVVLQISGRSPDSEGIEHLGLTKDLAFARESLVDATCRFALFLIFGKACWTDLKELRGSGAPDPSHRGRA